MIPILSWLPRYAWGRDLVPDMIAGATLAALLIPESLGYAGVAGVTPVLGLYAALAAALAYAVFGGTKILVVSTAAGVAAVTNGIIVELTDDLDPAVAAAALAGVSGLILLVAGLLRIGWIVNFISRPVLEAFVAGLCISIIVGQLGKLVGVEVDGESPVEKFRDLVSQIGDWDGRTVAVGVGAIATLLLLERFARQVPAALLVVAVGIVLVAVFDLDVATVGDVPTGLPDLAVPDLSVEQWLELLGSAFALVLVGLSEGYAAASEAAEQTHDKVDPDQELIGSGVANVAAGLAGGIAVSGSLSKSAAARAAGARTQMTNVAAGAVVLATLLFLAPLFEDLPETMLAAVVIVAVLRSADPRRVTKLWAVNRFDFVAGAVTFLLVLVWDTLPAMIVGVLLSLVFLVYRASFPHVVELGRTPDGRLVSRTPDATVAPPPDGAILRFDAPLIYANADRFTEAAERLVEHRAGLVYLVLDAEVVSDLDATGAEHLAKLDDHLAERGVSLRLARVHSDVREQIARSHLGPRFAGRIFDDVETATVAQPLDR
jgi:high affinity sulfate transporter 1